MGQMTHGVLYGAKISGLEDEDDSEAYSDLYDALHEIGADLRFIDSANYSLAGFWLAVGASGRDGVPFLETVQLSEIPVVYSERYDAAKAAWSQVEAAVVAAGVKDFAPPSFWIAETEVA